MERMEPTDPTPWASTPFIELPVYRVACPVCGSPDHALLRSEANGEGTATRKAECRICGKRFRIVAIPQTLPTIGKWTLPRS